MLTGINHITLAVSNLQQSFVFYASTLGMQPQVKWQTGAYFSAGDLWLCLAEGPVQPSRDYSHIAFYIEAKLFANYREKLLQAGVKTWQKNTSEGQSLYLLDPDGHKLEIHAGNLQTRLKHLKKAPYKGLIWF